MKKEHKTRKSLDQIMKEPGGTFWGKLLSEEARERKTNENKRNEQPKP